MLQEIDLHVVLILLLLIPISLLGLPFIWAIVVIALVPQGRILVRSLVDYPAFKKPSLPYLIANEIALSLVIGICIGGRQLMYGYL